MTDNLLNAKELAEHLGCRPAQVYRLVARGMPTLRLGPGPKARLRFDLDEVHAWLAECSRVVIPARERRAAAAVFSPRHLEDG